jgi:raffinose/stachyose/melibiose transport system permease protein
LAGLQGIPEEVYESGDMDGAVGWKRFWYITLPLLARMFQMILMLAIIGSMQIFDLVKVLTAGGPSGSTEVMMTYIYSYFFPSSYAQSLISQVGYGSALGMIASLIIGAVTLIYLVASRKMDDIA